MALQRLVTATWTNLGKKSKERPEPSLRAGVGPEGVSEKGNVADPVQFSDTPDRLSADVGRPHSSTLSDGEDAPSCQGILHETPASKPSIPLVDSDHDSTSLEASADPPKRPSDPLPERRPDGPPQLRRSKSILGTLKKKLRIRIPVPGQLEHIAEKPVSARTRTQNSVEATRRLQAVPITLSNDVTSRERREEALRARGLLPPREKPNLSAMEADEDRRIDALGRSNTSLLGPERTRSEANDIAQLWRQSNLRWLSEDLPDLVITADPMTEVASPIDISNDPEGPSEIPTDPSVSAPFATSSLSLCTLPSPSLSIIALSNRDPQDSSPLRGAALESTNQEGPALPSSSLEDLPFSVPTEGLSEDVNTHSTQLAASSPAPSKLSRLPEIVEDPQEETPALQTQKSVSPSSQLEDLKPLDSLHLLPNASDTCLTSPTTQTLSTSMCYSPLDTPDSPATGEFFPSHLPDIMPVKDPRANVTPLAVKNGEGELLCHSIIFEGPESFPDDEVVDPFAHPSSSPLSTPIPPLTGQSLTPPPPQRASNAALRRPKNRSSTLSALPSAAIPKSASMVSLRRAMSNRTNSLFKRPQPRSAVVQLDPTPPSPPPTPLEVTMYSDAAISMEASRIDDDEVRRLSELAFSI
ncbi:hypothetical protein BC827DRAFT_1243580 [Russula dissimulans]|nr:hypothetical protein BC827DRAFT_1243580 [Russula dissimulans]